VFAAPGSEQSVVVDLNGNILTCGSNNYGELGNGTLTSRTTFANVTEACTVDVTPPGVQNNIITATQSLCGSGVPSTLTGSTPSGCSGSYTYQWESSSNNSTWTIF
jgi:alpha-tubulin suppressor-like RCC1 family protein